jgi:hypothetical protein
MGPSHSTLTLGSKKSIEGFPLNMILEVLLTNLVKKVLLAINHKIENKGSIQKNS